MNSKKLLKIKSELREYLRDKEIYDIILFGSFVKGSESYRDIDVVFVTDKKVELGGDFHLAILSPRDFFGKVPSLVNTLLREGYSLKSGKKFSEIYGFSSFVFFNYDLSSLSASRKVKVVNALRGKSGEAGLVEDNLGEWVTRNFFKVDVSREKLFEKLFTNFDIKYKKSYALMH